jgi:cysteine desulfurase/selenocysteine lyase
MFGPTGIGVLYGKAALLEAMPPYQGGGDMIRSVTFAKTTYAPIPAKFEAGTPDIAGVVGLGAAVDYLGGLDRSAAVVHEQDLLAYATDCLRTVPGLTIVGTAAHKASVISFVLDGIHAHDVGTIVDQAGVAIRTGHHCTQPVMEFFGVPATARASFAFYNTRDEVDTLVESLPCRECGRCSADGGSHRAVSADHRRAQPEPSELQEARSPHTRGARR